MRKTFLSLGIRAVLMSGVLGMLPLDGQAQSLGLYPAAAVDTDHDRLSDAEELTLGTNPSLADTDGDFLSDSDEVFVTGTDPLLADSDLDGLTDYEEWQAQFPEPVVLDPENYFPQLDDLWWPIAHLTDYDMDGISDREEVMYGNFSCFNYKNTVRSSPVNGEDEDSEIWGSPDHWHPTDYDRDGLNATQETAWQTDPYDPDTDGDGLRDGVDAMLGDPLLADSNANGVNDREELMGYAHYSLNASSSLLDLLGDTPPGTTMDGDRDGMSDLWELANGLNPSDTLDAYDDPDGDFLFNIEEYKARSNPQALLSTAAQTVTIDAINPSTQLMETRVVVNDYEAVMGVPVPAGMVRDNGPISGYEYDDDWDGDGYKNRDEVLATPARNPRFDESQDTDGDGLLDIWETLKGLDKNDADENNNSVSDGLDDFDNDQLNNLGEQAANTNPQQADTDGDTLPDGWEVTKGLNALNGDQDSNSTADSEDDFDSDQLTNAEELTLGTHPLRMDTDFDGLPDVWELANQLNPNSASGINGGAGDADGDGFSNVAEMNAGSSPQSTGSTPPATFIFKSWSAQAEGYGDTPGNYEAWVTSLAESRIEEEFSYSTGDPIPKANEAAEWAEDEMKDQDYAGASVTPWTSYDTKQFPGGDVRWVGLTPHIVAVKSEFIWIGHEFYADYRRVRLEVETPVAAPETRSYLVLTETEASDSLEVVGSVEFALDAGQTKAAVTVDSALSQYGVTAAPDGETLCIEPPPSTLTVDGYYKKSVYLVAVKFEIKRGGLGINPPAPAPPNTPVTPTWQNQGGRVRDLVSVWDAHTSSPRSADLKGDWIQARLSLTGIATTELPEDFIEWTIDGHTAPAPNTLETPRLSWPGSFGVKLVQVTVGSKVFKVHVDVPNVGSIGHVGWGVNMVAYHGPVIGPAGALLAKDYGNDETTWSAAYPGKASLKNALRHSSWIAHCASQGMITVPMAIQLGRAHENDNFHSGNNWAYESTMDLHNNDKGATCVHSTFFGNPDTSAIRSDVIAKMIAGELIIWDSAGTEHTGFKATMKSNDLPLYP